MTDLLLIADPAVTAIPVTDSGEPLVDLRRFPQLRIDGRQADPAGQYAHVRVGVAQRLVAGQRSLPAGLRLLIVEGYRPAGLQRRYFAEYCAMLRQANPGWPPDRLRREASRYICPPEVAPHVAGAAVDLTLCTDDGHELPMGSEVNASPEDSAGACCTDARLASAEATANRRILVTALGAAGLVNYPTEWWHWSFGDRYWAVLTGTPAARYGPLPAAD
jgi:D-alanyl-D-alanine dipeptidase